MSYEMMMLIESVVTSRITYIIMVILGIICLGISIMFSKKIIHQYLNYNHDIITIHSCIVILMINVIVLKSITYSTVLSLAINNKIYFKRLKTPEPELYMIIMNGVQFLTICVFVMGVYYWYKLIKDSELEIS